MMDRSKLAAAPAAAGLVLALAASVVAPSASGTVPGPRTVAERPAAPSLLIAAPAHRLAFAAPAPAGGVPGTRRMVTLDRTLLPAQARGQRLSLPVGRTSETVRLTAVEHDPAYAAWTGTVEGASLSSFNLVRADGVYRGMLISPEGSYVLTRAEGDRYWWSGVAPRTESLGEDARVAGPRAATQDGAAHERSSSRGRGKVKVGVLFGYTKNAKVELGGKAELKAAAALVIAQTNEALSNSGLKVKMKLRGLVKAKGSESKNPVKDAFRVSRPNDGRFDNLQRVRKRRGGDIVHLLASGDPLGQCGGGLIPARPRQATPTAGASVTFVGCLPYLVATHELGHNLGADHIDYPGVSHYAKLPQSFGYYNVAGGYITVMGYYDPCNDAGVTCVRIPYFSSPTNTYAGQPLGVGKSTNNALVIKKTAPRVARYVR